MRGILKAARGWDLVAALVVTGGLGFIFDARVDLSFATDIYALGTSVLAIVFSVFIAAFAIIMSSGSDDFVRFLHEEGVFSSLLAGFKVALGVLFSALVLFVFLFGFSSWMTMVGETHQHSAWLLLGIFVLCWALFSTASAARAAVAYSEFRARFVKVSRRGAGSDSSTSGTSDNSYGRAPVNPVDRE